MSVKTYLRKFGNLLATILLTAFAIGVGGFGVMKFFTIRTIEIQGAGLTAVVDQKKLPKNLLFFPSDHVRAELLAENPLLAGVAIQKKFPHTLVIIPISRIPIAHLLTSGRLVDVDREGIIVREATRDRALPTLQFDLGPVRIGEKISDPSLLTALAFIDRHIVPVDMITLLDSQSLRVQSGKTNIYITHIGNIQVIADTLQTLLTGFRIEGKLPATIDLRFPKPVVTF